MSGWCWRAAAMASWALAATATTANPSRSLRTRAIDSRKREWSSASTIRMSCDDSAAAAWRAESGSSRADPAGFVEALRSSIASTVQGGAGRDTGVRKPPPLLQCVPVRPGYHTTLMTGTTIGSQNDYSRFVKCAKCLGNLREVSVIARMTVGPQVVTLAGVAGFDALLRGLVGRWCSLACRRAEAGCWCGVVSPVTTAMGYRSGQVVL